MKIYRYANSDDFSAVYVDGKRVPETHGRDRNFPRIRLIEGRFIRATPKKVEVEVRADYLRSGRLYDGSINVDNTVVTVDGIRYRSTKQAAMQDYCKRLDERTEELREKMREYENLIRNNQHKKEQIQWHTGYADDYDPTSADFPIYVRDRKTGEIMEVI